MADKEKDTKKQNANAKKNTQKKNSGKNAVKGKAKVDKKAAVKKDVKKTTNTTVKKNEKKVKDTEVKKDAKNAKDTAVKKNEKKENVKQARQQLYYSEQSTSNEMTRLIKIILIITVIFCVFYGVTVVVLEKAKEASEEESEAVEIQYDSIIIGSMLKINGSFYVLIEEEDDVRLTEYTTMIQLIQADEDAPTIYTADLSSTFNKKYLSDETNYDSDMSTFKVSGTTLVKISDHEITDVYDDYESIVEVLEDLL